ncbi:DNA topoisomerase IB [Rhodobacterales bacterium HKCCE2091]|nr:DNA topoisomerase IB [Rhodobacterales bacterium HKCCE2091]
MTAKLIYYPDNRPGITRRRCGKGFAYYLPAGALISDKLERDRIAAIAVPPAYTGVWITPEPWGHLQATGRDAKGRKQYRYHPDWQAIRSERKYAALAEFGRALPRLRGRIAAGLGAEAGSQELALAAVLALLDRAAIRIGHPDYARENESFGATTLLRSHARMTRDGVNLSFPGKSGSQVSVTLRGDRLGRALHRVRGLSGAELISWRDAAGQVRAVRSEAVNGLIEDVCGPGMSAKTFRTWTGTHAAFLAAQEDGPLTIAAMAGAAADRLHNTPAIARSSYIHPAVLALADLDTADRAAELAALEPVEMSGLRAGEGALIAMLEGAGTVRVAAE